MRFSFFITFICLVSCKAQKDAAIADESIGIELIASDPYSGILEYEAAIISDKKTLNKFYSRINRIRKPGLPVPDIDFTKNVLLAVCLGEQKAGNVPMVKKSEAEDNVLITIGLSEKNNASATENATSHPFHIYKLDSTSKTVEIQKLGF